MERTLKLLNEKIDKKIIAREFDEEYKYLCRLHRTLTHRYQPIFQWTIRSVR